MSNRLAAEQFGGSNKNAPKRLDQVMTESLAEVCKQWIGDGKTKESTIKWISDRFDPKGKLNVDHIDTDLQMVMKGSGKPNGVFIIQQGRVFAVDSDRCEVFMEALHDVLEEEGDESLHAQCLLNFMGNLIEEYNSYVVWRMCSMDERANDHIIYGCFVRDIERIDDGPVSAAGRPYPVLGSVLKLLLNTGILDYTGDFVL